ncbi:unnamed protein product [Amoebophrya sp. A120]|nr:unnamed protein product [Amoebophrya sp. A120]|eukprot:GSA120T00013006001.1
MLTSVSLQTLLVLLLAGSPACRAGRQHGSGRQWLRTHQVEVEPEGGLPVPGAGHDLERRASHEALRRRFPGMAHALGGASSFVSTSRRGRAGDVESGTAISHTSEVGTVIQPYSGAPACVLDSADPYSCSFTEAEISSVSTHLERRAMVSFLLLLALIVAVYVMKSLFEFLQRLFRDVRYFNVMFVKCVEQLTILGLIIALSFSLSSVALERRLDDYLFPDKDRARWDLTKYASNDVREGAIYPEMSVLLRDFYLLLTALMLVYVLFVVMIGANLSFKFKKYLRFEFEAENEVHVKDDPVDKVNFLLWRRSMVTPMVGHRSEELNSLRNPLQEFSFVQYLQEVLSQYMQVLFHIPTSGLAILVFISSVECFLEIETLSRTHAVTLLGLSTATWSWCLLALLLIFFVHLRRVREMLTPPPAAMLWHLDPQSGEKLPDRHLLPPFRLVPYLKEAPKKTKFFYWWYGTFSPNQQEQLFFRWRKGPATILGVLQTAIFVYATFVALLLRNFSYVATTGQGSLWYAVVGWTAALIALLYIIPESIMMLVICSSTNMMPNRRAIHAVVKEHSQEYHNLSTTLLEMAQISAMKEKLETPALAGDFNKYLQDLYEVIFSQDQKDLFEAGWKIHNWNATRGMNPTELKECMEHLGFEDSEIVIGEWWLVFDSAGEGTLHHDDFVRMLTARHIIKYGLISVEDLVALFQTHPNGETITEYNRLRLSEYLVSFRVDEPRLGAVVLIREARFLADERAGLSDQEIMRKMMDMEAVTVTPQELAEFLYTKQNYRTRLDTRFIDHMRQVRELERQEELQRVAAIEQQRAELVAEQGPGAEPGGGLEETLLPRDTQ